MVNEVERKAIKFDYRRFYKEYYGIDFGPDMAIHHIDFDRKNNRIENLLLMPRSLHAKYHFAVNSLQASGGYFDGDIRVCNGLCGHKAEYFKQLSDALIEIEKWINLKRKLDVSRGQRKSVELEMNFPIIMITLTNF